MKKLKLLGIVFGLVAVLAMSVPAYAATPTVTTGVTILSGSGLAPMVKAKWETTNITDPQAENGDPNHLITGTQVLPNAGFQATTNVTFWAIVTDPAGVGNIAHVYADVYYPGTGVADPGPNGSLKFEIELFRVNDAAATLVTDFNLAANIPHPLAVINPLTPLFGTGSNATQQMNDIVEELLQGSAALYRGTFYFDNCELAGDYLVTIAASNGQNVKGYLSNTLNWLPLTAAEWDFTGVDYGNVAIGVHKQIDGNYAWAFPAGVAPDGTATTGTAGATIRNIGNTYVMMTVKQDDLGLGQTNVNGVNVWNVHYDARLGADPAGYINYDPSVVKLGNLAGASAHNLIQSLKLCAYEKVDFSITVDKDSVAGANHSYQNGAMVLGAVNPGNTPTPAPQGNVYPFGTTNWPIEP